MSVGECKTVIFTSSSTYNYPPTVWGDEELEVDSWDDGDVEYEEEYKEEDRREAVSGASQVGRLKGMEPDDGMSCEGNAVEEEHAHTAVVVSSVAPTPTTPTIM